ncbi:MAG: trigger factor [Acidobacteriia bacterium]|nr:trigger factor [Terriglobia bacterium]MYG04296.1 trigger factor [Terriglobia bacterium]MYK09263.1 trigger factor [Terriglobia bacterium]
MESGAEQKDPCARTVTVEIPWDVVEKERRDYVKQARQSVTVPGFRKGRAPEVVLYRYFEKEISVVLTERLAPGFLSKKIGSMDQKLAAGPYITDFRFVEGRPFEVDAQYEVFPRFELGEYRDLKVVHEAEAVTDERVDAELGRLREQHASVRTLDPRPVQDKDVLRVTFSAVEHGPELPFFGQELTCDLSRDQSPGGLPFTRELPGLEPGEETEISCQCPDDYPDPEIAGKTVECKATVHSILEVDLPELDDEFAKDVNGNHETLDDLKGAVRKELETRADLQARAATEFEVMNQLATSHQIDVPRQHLRERLQRLAERMEGREGTPEQPSLTPLNVAQEAMAVCAEQVLDRIADVEDIDLSHQEIQDFVNRFAESEQLTPERARDKMEESGILASMCTRGRRSKAMQLVIDSGAPFEEPEPRDSDGPEERPEPAADSSGDE